MPLFSCDFEACRSPSVRKKACRLCNRHLCGLHLVEDHECPDIDNDPDGYFFASGKAEELEVNQRRSQVDPAIFSTRASYLRNGISCLVDTRPYSFGTHRYNMGGMNYHVDLVFEDGSTWIARVRRQDACSSPLPIQHAIQLSEAATMSYLASHTSIPVPKLHDLSLEGFGSILMDKAPGNALNWNVLDATSKRNFLMHFASVFNELWKQPFDTMGCLTYPQYHNRTAIDRQLTTVGPFVEEMTTDFTHGVVTHTMGPFSSILEYRMAMAKRYLGLILEGEAYTSCAIDAYLVHRWLLEVIPRMPSSSGESRHFFLKHMDDKGDHILVDDNLNITAIIDWEWAQTCGQEEAFAAPLFLIDVEAFYNGTNELSSDEALFVQVLEERGMSELAGLVRNGRIEHRLVFCLGGEMADLAFPSLFLGLQEALARTEGMEFVMPEDHSRAWKDWKTEALARYADDEGIQALIGA